MTPPTCTRPWTPAPADVPYVIVDRMVWEVAHEAVAAMEAGETVSALLLEGPPGCGKTHLGKVLASRLRAELMYFQMFEGCGAEELLATRGAEGGWHPGVVLEAIAASRDHPVVLVIDELDKASPTVDAFFYGFLQEGAVRVPQCGGMWRADARHLLVVFTKNDWREASHPLLRRCRCAEIGWPPPEVEHELAVHLAGEAPAAMAAVLIGWATELRRDPRVRKPPSPPEVARLARDVTRMLQRGVRDNAVLGRFTKCALAVRAEDRNYFKWHRDAVGARLIEIWDEASGADSEPAVAPGKAA